MLNWDKMSLRRQFILLFILAQALLLIGLTVYFTYNEREFYLGQLKENLENEARMIRHQSVVELERKKAASLDQWVKEMGPVLDKRITIIDSNGIVLADSSYDPEEMDNHLNRPEVRTVMTGEDRGVAIRRSATLEMKMYYLAIPIKDEDKITGFIRLSESLQDINLIISRNIKNNLLFLLLMLIITLLIIWKFSKDIIGPLNKITESANQLARGKFQERIKVDTQNEIGTLGRMFNYMAAQLESKVKQISDEKNRAEAILTSMVNGLIAVDRDMRVRLINPAAREMFVVSPLDVGDKELIEVIRHHQVNSFLQSAMEENEIASKEVVLQRNEDKIFRCNFVPINNEEGQVSGGVVVFNDISELRRLEQLRTEFVANVSHELRTPLTSIIGYVNTILDNEIDDLSTIKRFLKIIKTEADRLALLIKDLLDLSKLESRDRQLPLIPAKLENMVDKTIVILKDQAGKKGIEIRKEMPDDLPLVYMIPEQIEQVLMNLIDNSVKYTPAGGVIIVRLKTEQEFLTVEIEDSGVGIPEEAQKRIFERFYRVDKARSRSLGGTGIGLSIVKHIIQNHQSEIIVDSEPGKGSCFSFKLKRARL